MGTWDAGVFDNDGALDFVGGLMEQLQERIDTWFADVHADIGEGGEAMVMPSVAIMQLLTERCGSAPPKPDVIIKWRTAYLQIFDRQIDNFEPDEDYKKRRREVIAQTFQQLENASSRFWNVTPLTAATNTPIVSSGASLNFSPPSPGNPGQLSSQAAFAPPSPNPNSLSAAPTAAPAASRAVSKSAANALRISVSNEAARHYDISSTEYSNVAASSASVSSVTGQKTAAKKNTAAGVKASPAKAKKRNEEDEDEDIDDVEDDEINDGVAGSDFRRFEFVDDKSKKFWEIKLDGNSYTARWGRIGTAGQSITKDYPGETKAKKEYEKLILEKITKGYEEV